MCTDTHITQTDPPSLTQVSLEVDLSGLEVRRGRQRQTQLAPAHGPENFPQSSSPSWTLHFQPGVRKPSPQEDHPIIPSLLGLAAAMSLEAQTVYGILEPKLEACASVLILHQPDCMFSALGVPSLLHGSS